MKRLCLLVFAVCVLSSLSVLAQAGGSVPTVFQIGKFDRSSSEFAGGAPQKPVDFHVGSSRAATDWYGSQPAAVLSSSGQPERNAVATAPRAITFTISGEPAAAYHLHVALLVEDPGTPNLRVGINSRQGTFYLHPKLDFSNGDQWDSFYPAYSRADVEFDFPGSLLKPGQNRITLQAVISQANAVAGARLVYDAIELDQAPASALSAHSTALLQPTIFYGKSANGLDELVNLYLRYDQQPRPETRASLHIAGKTYTQTAQSSGNFGEEKLQFAIPALSGPAQAQVEWNVTGRRQREQVTIQPQKKWTLFLVPHIHLDVGYSDYQGKVASIQARALEEAMEMAAKHPGYRFSTDGSWNLAQFLKTYSPAQKQKLITAIRNKQIFIPADYANLLTGFPTAETLIRSLYFSADFSRKHGTPFNYASITDVPSWSWSYASILAAAGIHDLVGGSNNYRAPVLLQGRLNENSPFWWQGPDGAKVLVWYSRIYQQMQMLFGLPPKITAGRATLPLFLQQYEYPGYKASAAILYGTQVENTDLFPQQATFAQTWNSQYAYPHIEYSGFHHALQTIAAQFGNSIPTVRGGGGPYWEDGIASDARYAAMERHNEARGPSAEKLATLASLVDPQLGVNTKGLRRMWTNMVLMDEHTFDSYNSISDPGSNEAVDQLAVKNAYAKNAKAEAAFISRNSMASLANSITAGRDSIIVFNTLNWQRTAPVTVDMDRGDSIVDVATGQAVPVEVLGGDHNDERVRFMAQNVPAVGYKVYKFVSGSKSGAAPAPAVSRSLTLESPYYRVELDPATGAVRSIYDKQLHRELVNQSSPYRFGQYLYVTGGDHSPNTILNYSRVYPKPHLVVHPASNGRLLGVTRTPWGWEARMVSTDTNTPRIETEIRLFEHTKKIEFVENVDKKSVTSKEGVYFAFPFAMSHPEFEYEIQNGVINPAKDMYPGAGHVWFSVQHWAAVQQDGVAGVVMPLDASLMTFGDINHGQWPEQFGSRPGNIFSYVMNNYWDTNYRAAQGGHFQFRYVITSAPSINEAALSRMGWEAVTPLEHDIVTSQDKALNTPRALNGKQDSFLTVSDPDVLLSTWKPAEDGNGTILRFLNLDGTAHTVTVQTPLLQLEHVWQADAVERNQKPLPLEGTDGFQFTMPPHGIVTVRLLGRDVTPAPKP